MIDAIRIVLVDPGAGSKTTLGRQIGGVNEFDLVDVCQSYASALKRVAALSPDLVVVVTDDDPGEAMGLIATITEGLPEVTVLPAGEDQDAGVILQVVRAGAREFLPLPTPTLELVEMVRGLNPRRLAPTSDGPRKPSLIAVTGAAGGVGCTSIAVNLATNLAKLSRRDTAIADFDLLLGSLEECLDTVPDRTIEGVVRQIDEMNPTTLKRWLPKHASGIHVMTHPAALEVSAQLEMEDVRRVVSLLKDTFDAVVVDTSKALQGTDFLAFEAADVILVVLQLNVNCTRNTFRLTNYLRSFEGYSDKIRLVANRTNSPQSEISVKKAEELLKAKLQYQVSNSTKLFRPARTLGVPIDEVDGGAGSKVHQELLEMARDFLPAAPEPVKARKRMFPAFR